MSNALFENVYNPDVLSCLANLSNDEVFTPPDVVNKMLDMLPQELFRNPDTTFLDPACKTGVFLREIAKRLIVGLEPQIPDLQERVDHIFQKQLYGIAITELTSLLSRRGVYCSKYPNSEFSVSRFDDAQGNIRYKRIPHTWGKTTYDSNGKPKASCIWCGASKSEYDRSSELETHAYEWIHTQNPEELFKMKFDVIIGNPPYQLSDGGHGASAIPIYQKFIEQSKKLMPRYLIMITPSRWFTGGRGLEEFRNKMLHDEQIRIIHDFPDASDCFPGVEIKGGVSFFLWEKNSSGDCRIITHHGTVITSSTRPLLENGLDIFIRDSNKINILHKVQSKNESLFYNIMSANDPFGYDVRVENSYLRIKPQFKLKPFDGAAKFYYFGWRNEGIGYIDRSTAKKGQQYIDKWKLLIPRAWGSGDPGSDRLNAIIAEPNTLCTETYSVIGPFDTRVEAENVLSYINTKFFHFMVSIVKITQAGAKHVYKFVPMQDFSKPWTDAELYTKYNLTQEEIDFIEFMIKPMDSTNIKED